MTTLREAAARALEVLVRASSYYDTYAEIAALKAALAEPVQEPVAWAEAIIDDLHALHDTELIREVDSGDALIRLDAAIAAVEEAEQRHTSPPQRKPLTEEDLRKLADKHLFYQPESYEVSGVFALARAIERAHGIT